MAVSTRIVAWSRVDTAVQEVILTTGSLTRRAVQSMIDLALQGGGGGGIPAADRAALVAFRTRTDPAEQAPTANNWQARPVGFGVVLAIGVAPAPADAGPLDLRFDRPDLGSVAGVTTFTGADTTGWPDPWAAGASPAGGGASTESGWGVLTTGTTNNAAAFVSQRFGATPSTDADVLFTFRRDTAGARPQVVLRSTTDTVTPGTAVVVEFTPTAVTVSTVAAGTPTQVGTTAKTFTVATGYRARVQVTGTTVNVRTWPTAGAEPGTWDLTANVSTGPASGHVGLGAASAASGAQKTSFDDVLITTSAGTASGYGFNYGATYGV